MDKILSLQTIYDTENETALPLPKELERLYGRLAFPFREGKPYFISNFVETLDGVVTLGTPGHEGGGDISGHNQHDLMVFGLLRAAADAVVITSTSLKVGGNRLHIAEEIFPPFAGGYLELRRQMGKAERPLQVVVTARGELDVNHRIFQAGEGTALVVTTEAGQHELVHRGLPPFVPIVVVKNSGLIDGQVIADAIGRVCKHPPRYPPLLLSEGGPHLLGALIAGNCLDELFLTLAPQIAGRDGQGERLGLVGGYIFAPDNPRWENLVSVKRGGGFLFLRYRFGKT
jgi:riboflavin biosynthesis pyrimidine reductase